MLYACFFFIVVAMFTPSVAIYVLLKSKKISNFTLKMKVKEKSSVKWGYRAKTVMAG